MYLPEFGCTQSALDDMCDFLDEIIATGDVPDDGDGVTTRGAFFGVDDDCSVSPDEDDDEVIIDPDYVLEDEAESALFSPFRDAYRRMGEPTGEMLTAYSDGTMTEAQREDLELILSLRPDLRIEIEVRKEMAKQGDL